MLIDPHAQRPKRKLRSRKDTPDTRKAIVEYLSTNPYPSIREIGEAVGLRSSSTVWSHIRKLRLMGVVAPAVRGQSRRIILADDYSTTAPILSLALNLADRYQDDDHRALLEMLIAHFRGAP